MTVHSLHTHRAEIRLAGSGGQGLITGMHILFRALAIEGKRAAQSQSYEPTSRGGFCYSDLVVSDESGDYPLATRLDMVAVLSQIGLDRSLSLIAPGALLVVDERLVPDPPKSGFDLHVLPIAARAVETGSPRIANVVALGALAHLGQQWSRDLARLFPGAHMRRDLLLGKSPRGVADQGLFFAEQHGLP